MIESYLEKKPSTLLAIDLPDRDPAILAMRVGWRPDMGSLARRPLHQMQSNPLEISGEMTLLSP